MSMIYGQTSGLPDLRRVTSCLCASIWSSVNGRTEHLVYRAGLRLRWDNPNWDSLEPWRAQETAKGEKVEDMQNSSSLCPYFGPE